MSPPWAWGHPADVNFCHVQGNRASDDKPEKVTARAMISMVKDINAKLTAANLKPAVTCYTCHRGKTEPENAAAAGRRKPGSGRL